MKVVKIVTNSIKLGQFLKFLGLVSMGGEVKNFLVQNTIKVNNVVIKQRGKQLFIGDIIEINREKFILEEKNDF